MRIDILFITTILVVCYTLLFWNIIEGYNTDVELDNRSDEDENIILSEEEKKLLETEHAKLQQLRAIQQANRREADFGIPNVYGFTPKNYENVEEQSQQSSYSTEQTSPH